MVGDTALARRLGAPRPQVVDPYSAYEQAVAAMQDSPPIDGFAEHTNRNECLMTCTWPRIRPRRPRGAPTTGTGSR